MDQGYHIDKIDRWYYSDRIDPYGHIDYSHYVKYNDHIDRCDHDFDQRYHID